MYRLLFLFYIFSLPSHASIEVKPGEVQEFGSPWNPQLEIPTEYKSRESIIKSEIQISAWINSSLDAETKTALRVGKVLVDSAKAIIPSMTTHNVGVWVKTADDHRILLVIHSNTTNLPRQQNLWVISGSGSLPSV